MAGAREVSLTVPANPDNLVIARLALSAICRLTRLRSDDVSDLKLAITEAASGMLRRNGDGEVQFRFAVGDEALEIRIADGNAEAEKLGGDELSEAIVAATVDSYSYENGEVRLLKYLGDPAE